MLGRRQGQILAGGSTVLLAALMPVGVAQAAPAGSAKTAVAPAACDPAVPFSSEEFEEPTRIDNEYLPMVPGTRLTYEGNVQAGGGTTNHQVVFTVTDMTQVIDGVRTRVVYDVDMNDGEVVEAELAFFAQSEDGNVWNLGEYPEEYENGKFAGAPSVWIAGLDGASGGIHMLADPEDRDNRHVEYLQGSAPAIDFLDCAQVTGTDDRVTVPAGDYCDVLTTHERSPLEADAAVQVKEHAPDVGIVRISAINDPEAETLELVEVAHLGQREQAAVDDQVVALDRHGHLVSDVYSQTPHVTADDGRSHRDG
jgi:hypothetical protein